MSSRIHQELSRGIVTLNNARKIKDAWLQAGFRMVQKRHLSCGLVMQSAMWALLRTYLSRFPMRRCWFACHSPTLQGLEPWSPSERAEADSALGSHADAGELGGGATWQGAQLARRTDSMIGAPGAEMETAS